MESPQKGIDQLPYKIEVLDGGFASEMVKVDVSNGRKKSLKEHPEFATNIYQGYIDLKCDYVTTGNFGLRPFVGCQNWKELTEIVVKLLSELKQSNDHPFTLLGCIPPYYKAYAEGELTKEVHDFYEALIDILEPYIDKFMVELVTQADHCNKILELISAKSSKDAILSIYPNGTITLDDMKKIIGKKYSNLKGICIHCCSYEDMLKFYKECIEPLDFTGLTHFGFYLNKIEEKQYLFGGNNVNNLKDLYNDEFVERKKLVDFLKSFNKTENLILGGCCGYGHKEMKEYIDMINNLDLQDFKD